MSSKSEAFFAAIEARRSYYALTPKSTLSDAELEALVKRAVKFTPTSFNMQHTRAVLVTGEMNQKVWDTIKEIKTKDETEDHAKATADKIDGVFKAGYGTVLFFSETAIVDGWGNQMPPYAEAFKVWDGHASGMLHYNVWTALELEGHGANLQHVAEGAPAIQEGIKKLLGLPETWHNTALLTFGVPGADPQEKTFAPIEERVKVSTGAASA
jgi:predicted oxidoreductase (fatty acid repression mutant protein)